MAPSLSRILKPGARSVSRTKRRSGCCATMRAISFAIFSYGALTCQAESLFNFATTPGQLPKDVVPSAYRIDIAPDLERLKFTAREEIDVNVERATDVVTVNAVDLAIGIVALVGEDSAP